MNGKKIFDYHIHTHYCKHADGDIFKFIESAISKGFKEIGFADHSPMPEGYDPKHRMIISQLESYFNSIDSLRSRYPEIKIKIGLESDYFPGTEKYVEKVNSLFPFDYIIGSVHFVKDWAIDMEEDKYNPNNIDTIFNNFLCMLEDLAKTKLYDFIGHFDLTKRFGFKPSNEKIEQLQNTINAIKKSNMGIEINTSGLRYKIKEIYPSPILLKEMKKNQIPIVFGSDSHVLGHIGFCFDEASKLAQNCGYTQFNSYEKRVAIPNNPIC